MIKNGLKKIILYITSIVLIIAVFFAKLLSSRSDRPSVRPVRDGIKEADASLDRARDYNSEVADSAGKLESGNRELQESIERSRRILEEIRKSKVEKLPNDRN